MKILHDAYNVKKAGIDEELAYEFEEAMDINKDLKFGLSKFVDEINPLKAY